MALVTVVLSVQTQSETWQILTGYSVTEETRVERRVGDQ